MLFLSGNGVCSAPAHCQCTAGWEGANCSTAICAFDKSCGPHGICVRPDTCACNDGYQGSTCSEIYCAPGCGVNGESQFLIILFFYLLRVCPISSCSTVLSYVGESNLFYYNFIIVYLIPFTFVHYSSAFFTRINKYKLCHCCVSLSQAHVWSFMLLPSHY